MAATTAAIASTASALGGSYMSFRQAAQQRRLQGEARDAAEKMIQEARKRADQNVFEALSVNKEPYNRMREDLVSQGAEALRAGIESDRGAGAVAGRVLMAQNVAGRNIAEAQGLEQSRINELVAGEEGRLQDYLASLSEMEAEGAQMAEAQAQQAAAQATAQGFTGLTSAVASGSELLPLYYQGKGAKRYSELSQQALGSGLSQEQLQNELAGLASRDPRFAKLSGVGYTEQSKDAKGNKIEGKMTPMQFQDYLSQDPALLKMLIEQNIFAPRQTQSPTMRYNPGMAGQLDLNNPAFGGA